MNKLLRVILFFRKHPVSIQNQKEWPFALLKMNYMLRFENIQEISFVYFLKLSIYDLDIDSQLDTCAS